jgi:amino-acid N-acetyltransferase
MLQLTDLREILRYVPQFRDKVFVISMDGAAVESENFSNLLLDIALLRSLRIGVALVHGASHQLRRLAEQTGQQTSNLDGTGVTDAATLQLALTAANRVTHEILEGLAAVDLNGAYSNAVVAHPAGILQGVDYLFTGRVDRVNAGVLGSLLQNDIVPVIPPLGCDGEGRTYRLNSDAVAVDVARALRAVKLIYLSSSGIVMRGDQPLRQLSVEDATAFLKQHRAEMPTTMGSKLEHAVRAARGGVPRVHIVDASVELGLLGEVFSNEGVGTLVHANEYQAIRQAHKKDVRAIYKLIQASVENDELVRRTRSEIERHIGDYFVFEIDSFTAGCVAVHQDANADKAELACLCVDAKFEGQGIGARLTRFAEDYARSLGVSELLALSTQTFNFFVQKGGFQVGSPDDLPPARRERYDRSGRRSLVLKKKLKE